MKSHIRGYNIRKEGGKDMNADDDLVRLTEAEALTLARDALGGIGLSANEACLIAEHLVENMLCGYEFAGLPRILAIAEHPNFKQQRDEVKVVRETATSAVIDGGNHPGYAPVLQGALLAATKARAHGMAVVGVNNCWFSGRNAYYLEQIAQQGLVAIHTASGAGYVVPPGATRAALGTNPMGFAIPTAAAPLIFDMGTSATMWGDVVLQAMLGKPLSEGVGVDAEGRPTTSAAEVLKGGVLPFGGHKGFGLSLIVQAFGVLAGARRASGEVIDSGFLFIVIDPEILMPRDDFYGQVSEMLDKLRALPRRPGVEGLRMPSERAFAERIRRRQEGVSIPVEVHRALRAMIKE